MLNFTDPFFSTRVLGFESLFDRLQTLSESSSRSSYPPYNIRRDGNDIFVEVAVAGLTKEDLDIELAEGILSISYAGPNTQVCLLYTSPSPRDGLLSRMPSSA